jgi:hypothetical protein
MRKYAGQRFTGPILLSCCNGYLICPFPNGLFVFVVDGAFYRELWQRFTEPSKHER